MMNRTGYPMHPLQGMMAETFHRYFGSMIHQNKEHEKVGETSSYGSDFHRHMAQYWCDVKEDMEHGGGKHSREMLDAMAMVAAEAVRYCLAAMEPEHKHGKGKEKFHKLEEAVEKLRRSPLQDRGKMMKEMFPNLQGRGQRVLQDMVSMESTEARARRLSMSKTEYMEAKEELAETLHEEDED
jgi:hypothetical protein